MQRLTIVFSLFVLGCSSPDPKTETPATETVTETATKTEPSSRPSSEPMTGAASGVSANRIESSTNRLKANDGGKVILAAIEKAGGLEKWFTNPLRFRFNYVPLAGRPPIDTLQVIDTKTAKARHLVTGSADDFGKGGIEFGWTGADAWSQNLPEDSKTNPRFWSLTPYYFVGVPFVLADPGVVLKHEGEETLDGKVCDVVRVTFEAGTGDAPDDYYVVYVDKKSSQIVGLRYIVTYKGFFPDGGHSKEKIMIYGNQQTVDGLTFATTHNTFKWDPNKKEKGDLVTKIAVSDFAVAPVASDFFDVPANAKKKSGF